MAVRVVWGLARKLDGSKDRLGSTRSSLMAVRIV